MWPTHTVVAPFRNTSHTMYMCVCIIICAHTLWDKQNKEVQLCMAQCSLSDMYYRNRRQVLLRWDQYTCMYGWLYVMTWGGEKKKWNIQSPLIYSLAFPRKYTGDPGVYTYMYILCTCITSSLREYHFNLAHSTTWMTFLGNDTVGIRNGGSHVRGCGFWCK